MLLLSACAQDKPEYRDVLGQPVSIKSSDKWTVIAYWADWCVNCRSEVASLNQLNHEPNVQVVGNYFRTVDKSLLQQLSQNMGIEFPVLERDLKEDFGWGDLVGLPTHYVVSPDNTVYGPYKGPFHREQLLTLIEQTA
tara:strand:+ start:1296 stop:1709 length:414 start_codon:yes stop_codon:yes gene_type:complete